MQKVNTQYPVLFGNESGAGENAPEGEDINNKDPEEGGGFGLKWGWIAWIDAAAETCRCSWDDVYGKPIMEFLNIICYTRDKAEEKKRSIEEWKRKH